MTPVVHLTPQPLLRMSLQQRREPTKSTACSLDGNIWVWFCSFLHTVRQPLSSHGFLVVQYNSTASNVEWHCCWNITLWCKNITLNHAVSSVMYFRDMWEARGACFTCVHVCVHTRVRERVWDLSNHLATIKSHKRAPVCHRRGHFKAPWHLIDFIGYCLKEGPTAECYPAGKQGPQCVKKRKQIPMEGEGNTFHWISSCCSPLHSYTDQPWPDRPLLSCTSMFSLKPSSLTGCWRPPDMPYQDCSGLLQAKEKRYELCWFFRRHLGPRSPKGAEVTVCILQQYTLGYG